MKTPCWRLPLRSGIAIALLLAFQALPASAIPAPHRITIAGLKGPTSIGMLKLMESSPTFGGVESRFEVVNTPDLMVARLVTGEADFAFLPLNLAANLYARGVPIELAATTGDGVLYVVTSRRDIHTLSDLKGKHVYDVARGSTPEFMLDYLLRRAGVDPRRDLRIDFTYSHLELTQQLAAGRVDCAVLPEPFATIAMTANRKLRVAIDLQRAWEKVQGTRRPYPTSALVVRRALAVNHPTIVRAVLDAERASIAWATAHPKEAGALAERFLALPAAVVSEAMPRLNLRFAPALQARPGVQSFLEKFFAFDPASIGGKLPNDGFYLSLDRSR